MARRAFSVVAAGVLIAFLCIQAAADEGKAEEKVTSKELIFGIGEAPAKQSVAGSLKANMNQLSSEPQNKILFAAAFCVFGFFCLIDGARSFQLVVVVLVGVLSGAFMLTQLGTLGQGMATTAAVEIGIFVAFAALLGWEGTQLLIGLGAGLYLYHVGIGLIHLIHDHFHQVPEHVPIHEANNTLVVAGYTLSVIVGTFLVNDKGGAARAFAIIAPLFGAAMVASSFEFMIMFYAATPSGKGLGLDVTIDTIPSVFEYLYMIVFPFHSRPVGYFTASHSNFTLGKQHYELDKIIGVGMWIVFTLCGICIQCKQINRLKRVVKADEGNSLRARLLDFAGHGKVTPNI